MGTNFVRFLISWRSVEPAPGQYDQAYLDRVEDRVGWYAERGYQVMLDMHQDVFPGRSPRRATAATAPATSATVRRPGRRTWTAFRWSPRTGGSCTTSNPV
ncbi:cellulase family glycosylhydrolase [Rhodococcus tukisamuensis]|uniref:cellulase family glycosylhydrolase n=1 Tax=Rhodococcus tukisamuensis TaxID=168276 RepID=UPI001FE1B3AF|nr:cellulase family glycosylhydrolase [Rhodococcus tukisamuensis]